MHLRTPPPGPVRPDHTDNEPGRAGRRRRRRHRRAGCVHAQSCVHRCGPGGCVDGGAAAERSGNRPGRGGRPRCRLLLRGRDSARGQRRLSGGGQPGSQPAQPGHGRRADSRGEPGLGEGSGGIRALEPRRPGGRLRRRGGAQARSRAAGPPARPSRADSCGSHRLRPGRRRVRQPGDRPAAGTPGRRHAGDRPRPAAGARTASR